MPEEIVDPCAIVCSVCSSAHHHDAGGGHCRECNAFLPEATDRQSYLFGKRLEQTALHDEGYVTVGGYVPGVHGDRDA